MTSPPTLESRLARVEQVIAALSREVAAIRAELGSSGTTESTQAPPAAPAPKAASAPSARPSARALDFERLLGRYGMLGIAVFAAVAAVGTFLSWAISQGYLVLGPAARVLLGLVFAAAISVWGLRLRRTERSFGSSVIGLALVIVLVCAYAAGPGFHLVPTPIAFAFTAAVAWGLAIFATTQDDEPLWCVAFGGGALAPFVTSDGTGSVYALLAYGLTLLVFGCFSIGQRRWPVAWRVFYAAAVLISSTADWLARRYGVTALVSTIAFPLVVGAAGVLPFAPESRKRAALRLMALLALLAAVAADDTLYSSLHPAWTGAERWTIAVAILVCLAAWITIIDRSSNVAQSSLLGATSKSESLLEWIDAAFIPSLVVFQAVSILRPTGSYAIPYAISAAMVASYVWRRPLGAARDAGAFALMLIGYAALIDIVPSPSSRIVLSSGLVLFALAAHALRPSRTWVIAGGSILIAAALMNVDTLSSRPSYTFDPFTTLPSATALAVTATLAIIARAWHVVFVASRRSRGDVPRGTHARRVRSLLRAIVAAPWLWAFIWVFIELSMAYSPSTSTLLLVTYFAATAVASVAVGRWRRSAKVRQIGLALAIAAAGTAVYGASTYFNSGVRIVAYLVTSAFLLGIAYWYRQPGASAAST